jgi:hypothetical protein
MNLLELQILAVISRIPDRTEVTSAHASEPVRASIGGRTGALAAPRIEERGDAMRSA